MRETKAKMYVALTTKGVKCFRKKEMANNVKNCGTVK